MSRSRMRTGARSPLVAGSLASERSDALPERAASVCARDVRAPEKGDRMSKSKIAIIGTGGTISSMADDSLEVLDYPETSRKIEPREAIQRVHEAARFAELLPLSFR